MDGNGNVVRAGEFGRGDLDLFKPDTSHSLTDGLLQFEPVGHRSAEMLQPAHRPGDSFGAVAQRPMQHFARVTLSCNCPAQTHMASPTSLKACSVPPRPAIGTCGPADRGGQIYR